MSQYFMIKMRRGVGMPWFERLGLRTLFRLQLFKPVLPQEASLLFKESS